MFVGNTWWNAFSICFSQAGQAHWDSAQMWCTLQETEARIWHNSTEENMEGWTRLQQRTSKGIVLWYRRRAHTTAKLTSFKRRLLYGTLKVLARGACSPAEAFGAGFFGCRTSLTMMAFGLGVRQASEVFHKCLCEMRIRGKAPIWH